jgi:hypothetical protein
MIRFDTRQIIVTPLWLGQAPTAPLKKAGIWPAKKIR